MSKNIKLNNTDYNGVSTVQLPTTSGGTATFKDTDEIITPSGTKTIIENGTFDVTSFAQAIVNVATSGGSDASGMESGTIVGNGTNTISIPVKSKKTHFMLWGNGTTPEEYGSTAYMNVAVFGISGHGHWQSFLGYNGQSANGTFEPESKYIEYEDNIETVTYAGSYCFFREESIDIRTKGSGGGAQNFYTEMTYNWLAW